MKALPARPNCHSAKLGLRLTIKGSFDVRSPFAKFGSALCWERLAVVTSAAERFLCTEKKAYNRHLSGEVTRESAGHVDECSQTDS